MILKVLVGLAEKVSRKVGFVVVVDWMALQLSGSIEQFVFMTRMQWF